MTQIQWNVQGEQTTHTVMLEYSFWTCHHRLWVDDSLVYNKRVLREFGAEVEFRVNEHKGTLFIDVPGRLTFAHSLAVEGCPVVAYSTSESAPLSRFSHSLKYKDNAPSPPAM